MPLVSSERKLRTIASRLLIALRLVLVLSLPVALAACQHEVPDGGGGMSHQP